MMSELREEDASEVSCNGRNIAHDLARWATAHFGESAEVYDVSRMPGHSGISFGFTVASGAERDAYILRVPPIGVTHRLNLDVVRFAPVLRLAQAAGVPVPAVLAASGDERWFGTPYLIVARVDGAPLPDVFESDQSYPGRNRVDSIFRQSIEALVQIHALPARGLLDANWAEPISRASDIAQWEPLLLRSERPQEVTETQALGVELLRSAPPECEPRVVHGDFYSNNWLVHREQLTAVLDWENATLSDPGWDLGWLATIYDPACWGPSRADSMTWHPQAEQFYAWYESASGSYVHRPHWYQALMCYRLACITPAKVRLHRSGRRVDPVWEVFAEAIPYQLDRALALLREDER
jgi:aminoglycoside phosphotransferase (APT) family kinase protein